MRLLIAPVFSVLLVACGSSAPPPAAPEPALSADEPAASAAAAPSAEPVAAKEESLAVPASCSANPCVMPPAVAKKLCSKANPDVAIALFAKDTPWTRVYVNVTKADSYNGQGGPSSEQKLTFDEELLVLAERNTDLGGMKVSGAGGAYDTMRWDGTCATLSQAEVTARKPPRAKHAVLPWRFLADATQRALRQDAKTASLVDDRKKQCKGVTSGVVSLACEKTDRALNDRIVEAVRGGLAVPLPAMLP
jgi:hypothetical protein